MLQRHQLENQNVKGRANQVPSMLPQKCIFYNAGKYLKGFCVREKLNNCIETRVKEKIRKVATERNDTTVVAMSSDELVAKESCSHASYYDLLNADNQLKFAVASSFGSKRKDNRFDVYFENSVKKAERGNPFTHNTLEQECKNYVSRYSDIDNIEQTIYHLMIKTIKHFLLL